MGGYSLHVFNIAYQQLVSKSLVSDQKEKIYSGEEITRKEAIKLLEEPLEELANAADEIRSRFCGNAFDMCTIINGKCGKCSEDCKYCAHYYTVCEESYPLLSTEELLGQAK
ncbi:MAG: hypothetical protein HDR01_11085 [Lachnospiraceae bacterium]|nr:hypothetical protein [Lachnospiraceae bacterium]